MAAVSPTLFSPAGGYVTYNVQAGDTVQKGQVLGTVSSPQLENELAREQATAESLEVAVARQAIETRKELLANQQTTDNAEVSIHAAERELKRAEDAWQSRAISQRDYEKARDDLTTARLAHEHAIENASLEKESLEFELKTRRLERDRQRLLVQDLKRRVDELTLRSPVDGVVGTLAVNQKAAVAANAALISVVDLTAFEIEFQLPESYADDIGLGMRQSYTVTMIKNNRATDLGAGRTLYAVPANVGPRTMDYESLFSKGTYSLDNGIKVFAGTTDDAFWIDLGAAFGAQPGDIVASDGEVVSGRVDRSVEQDLMRRVELDQVEAIAGQQRLQAGQQRLSCLLDRIARHRA